MKNVRKRLETRYGNEAAMTVTSEEEVFRVALSLPVEVAAGTEAAAAGELHPAKEVRA